MASSSGNPNQPTTTHFDMHKLFKPPSSPNPNPSIPTPTTATPGSYPPSPSSPFPYPPQPSQQFHPNHQYLHQQPPLGPPSNPSPTQYHHPYTFPPLPPTNPNSGAHIMALLGTPVATGDVPSHLESSVSVPSPSSLHSGSSGEFLAPPVGMPVLPTAPPAPPAILATGSQLGPARVASGKMPKGRHLSKGDQAVYDVDVRLSGETQPTQLEVTPITKYGSDPGLVLGRQIAVNRTYICYGLKLGAVRVLNINTALRSLLRGHNQRVSDMAFFAEDVHLLASASIDGRIFVWKINEGSDELEKPQITGKIVIAIQLVSSEELVHPRICWHCHKQEVLVVAIGNLVLKIDTTKVGRGETFTADEPLKCPVDKLIDGIQLVGKHDGEVTDLSMSQWMTTRLASASKDGMVKIWEDRKPMALITLRPHDGQPVNSVAFLTAPNHPDHIVLITAGPLNREVKIWSSSSEEGWLLPSDSESWHCTQTLVLKSSAEPRVEEAFFNQVVVLPQASLILLANAKKNAIYAVHIDYGPNPLSTCLDYITEFTVTMPILSLTGTTDFLPDGEQVVQVYCVQTQAIQQYALELSQCLPPSLDSGGLDKETSFSRYSVTTPMEGVSSPEYSPGVTVSEMQHIVTSPVSAVPSTICESTSAIGYPISSSSAGVYSTNVATAHIERTSSNPCSDVDSNISHTSSLAIPTNPDVPGRSSGFRSPPKTYEQDTSLGDPSFQETAASPGERRGDVVVTSPTEVDSRNGEKVEAKAVPNAPNMYVVNNNATHLITPSEILSGAITSYENSSVTWDQQDEAKTQEIVSNNGSENAEVAVKVVGENGPRLGEFGLHNDSSSLATQNKEKICNSDGSETNIEMVKSYSAPKTKIAGEEESQLVEDIGIQETMEQRMGVNVEEVQEKMKDVSESTVESSKVTSVGQLSTTKSKKKKQKAKQVSGPSSSSASPFNLTDSMNEQEIGTAVPPTDAALPQILAMQDTVNQLLSMHREMQKQMSATVAEPVTKEGRRVEASLGHSMERAIKANIDALWARFQEENAKREKLERERVQQISNNITNFMGKDFPVMLEKALKKEISNLGPYVARAITPILEKTISSAIVDSVQRVVGDKTMGQLEKSVNSKLEATVVRQIQTQFQTSGKQALQEVLRSTLEASVIPAFEQSCKVMFEQVDIAFQKGMIEHTAASQKQFESTHTPLMLTLRDAINSASSITQNLTNELAEGQRKLLALVTSGNQNPLSSMGMQQSNDPLGGLPMIEAPVDPTKELSRLVSERKFDEAFTLALQRSDVSIVSWLCSQVDVQGICSMTPLPLSQGVLLALLQQLACDISKETSRKLGWMTEVAVVINPTDPTIAVHVRPIFEQICQILIHQRSQPSTTTSEASSIRLILHVINSVLMSCK